MSHKYAVVSKPTKKAIQIKGDPNPVPVGTKAAIRFLGEHALNGSTMCELALDWDSPTTGRDFRREPMKTRITNLATYFGGFKVPGMSQLEKMVDAGVATTPTGQRVEPDGWGSDGSPSWLLVLGYI